jgi:aspartate racemase
VKLLGLIGGTSWESTVVYYQLLNRGVRDRLGGRHSARLLMSSLDFGPVEAAMAEGRWDVVSAHLIEAAGQLRAAGAEALLICANTMHKAADAVTAAVPLPLIHIADVTAAALAAAGATRPLLLGTRYTMEQPFLRERLANLGVATTIPDQADRDELHRIIFDELVVGIVNETSRAAMVAIIDKAKTAGADSVIFGCTEFGLLVSQAQSPLPMFDTAEVHARAALDWALAA